MTKSHYTTESHRYIENTPCDNPRECTRKSHWIANDDEHATEARARQATEMDDAPAIRIIKVRIVVERETLGVVAC